jgi:hypothetical protein
LYNAALTRYLDFNDSYLAKGETWPNSHRRRIAAQERTWH